MSKNFFTFIFLPPISFHPHHRITSHSPTQTKPLKLFQISLPSFYISSRQNKAGEIINVVNAKLMIRTWDYGCTETGENPATFSLVANKN